MTWNYNLDDAVVGTWWLIVGALAVLAVGCDGGGSKQASLYEKLQGTWNIRVVRLDGVSFDFRDRAVTMTFDRGDEGRMYTVMRPSATDTTRVNGVIELGERERIIMATGFEGPLVWHYTFDEPSGFDSTVQFSLSRASDRSVRSFLSALGLSGGAQTVRIEFVRD